MDRALLNGWLRKFFFLKASIVWIQVIHWADPTEDKTPLAFVAGDAGRWQPTFPVANRGLKTLRRNSCQISRRHGRWDQRDLHSSRTKNFASLSAVLLPVSGRGTSIYSILNESRQFLTTQEWGPYEISSSAHLLKDLNPGKGAQGVAA